MKTLQNISIKLLLYLSFFAMILIMAFIAIIRSHQLNNVMNRYNEAMYSVNSRHQYISSLEFSLGTINSLKNVNLHLATINDFTDSDLYIYRQTINLHRSIILEALLQYNYSVLNDNLLSEYQILSRLYLTHTLENLIYNQYFVILDNLFELLENNYVDQARDTVLNVLVPLINYLFFLVTELRQISFDFTLYMLENMVHSDNIEMLWFTVTSVVGFAIAILLAIFLVHYISTPILKLRKNVEQISLSSSSNSSISLGTKNELGKLSNDIAHMVNNIFEANKAVAIIDHMHTMLVVTDISDNIIYSNKSFRDHYKNYFNENESNTNKVIKIYSLDPLVKPIVEDIQRNFASFDDKIINFDFTWDEQIKAWINGHILINKWIDGRTVKIYYIHNATTTKNYINSQKKLEAQLRLALEQAEQANEAKSNFIANTSHEIRTPMNSIIGYNELALTEEISDTAREYLKKIDINAKWLLNIINDIMDFSKIEADKLKLHLSPFDLSDMVEHCKASVFSDKPKNNITFTCNIENINNKFLFGDSIKLGQICINILSNAIKFTETGSVKFHITKTNETTDNVTLLFTVTDTGIGMSKEQIAKIFEPFVQADTHTTTKYGGTGLGLAISKRLIELMGGTMVVESTIHVGSTFSFELTFPTVAATQNNKTNTSNTSKPNFVDINVLIVEDNHFNQEILQENLARCGIVSQTVDNGQKAINVIKDRISNPDKPPFDLIFMDINMPIMNGIEATKILTEMGVTTPVIATTANMLITTKDAYAKYGMMDYLSKPFTIQDLFKILNKYIKSVSSYTKDSNINEEERHRALLEKMKATFLRDNSDIYTRIEKAIEVNDFVTAHRYTHDLKTNSSYIQEQHLRTIAQNLEKDLKEGIANRLLLEQLKTELDRVIDDLKAHVPQEKETAKTNLNEQETLNLLNKLEELLVTNNTQVITYIPQLESLPNSYKLIQKIEDFHFQEALQTLQNMKEL